MTDVILIKTAVPIAATGVAAVAVIDPSLTTIIMAVISAFVVIIPIWIKYKTDVLNKKIDEVIKTTNGMKDALVKATAEKNLAVGKAEGKAEAESKAMTIIIAEAKGAEKGKAL